MNVCAGCAWNACIFFFHLVGVEVEVSDINLMQESILVPEEFLNQEEEDSEDLSSSQKFFSFAVFLTIGISAIGPLVIV